ncbi:MAG: tripartite tricarboxylate transporter substrate binding protein, partial [Lautropia sp.]
VRMVVPTGAGGGTDIVARLVAQKLAEKWGQSVLVDNRPGAEGVTGTETAAKARNDGYTLLLVPSGHTLNPTTRLSLPYDTLKDFAPITLIGRGPFALAVGAKVPVKNLKELAALAKAQPGKLSFASADASSRLAGEMFNALAGVSIVNVPYKSMGNAMTDLMGGHIEIVYAGMSSVMPHYRAGTIKLLGVSGATRSPLAPEVPTIAEAGWGPYEIYAWYGLLAPAGTPSEIIAQIQRDIALIAKEPEFNATLLRTGAVPIAGTPEAFAEFLTGDIERAAKVLKAAGVKPE